MASRIADQLQQKLGFERYRKERRLRRTLRRIVLRYQGTAKVRGA